MALRVLSMGWGVQSWTLAAMAIEGVIPPYDLIVHAATRERAASRIFADRWAPKLEAAGMRVVAEAAAAQDDVDDVERPGVFIPAFTLSPEGKRGRLMRTCTDRWKISVVRRVVRRELTRRNLARYGRDFAPSSGEVEMHLGISADESGRRSESQVQYAVNHFPLLDLGMTRDDCEAWLRSHGYPVPIKSACTFCPFRSPRSWEALRGSDSEDWAEAVQVDEAIRHKRPGYLTFLHPARRPLADVVSSEWDGREAADFDNGMCR